MRKLIPIFAAALSAMALITCSSAAATPDPVKALEAKADSLLTSMSAMNSKLSAQETSLNGHKTTMDGIGKTVNDLTKNAHSLDRTISNLNTKITHQESMLHDQQSAMANLTNQLKAEFITIIKDEGEWQSLVDKVVSHSNSIHVFQGKFHDFYNITRTLSHTTAVNGHVIGVTERTLPGVVRKSNSTTHKLTSDEGKIAALNGQVNGHSGQLNGLQTKTDDQTKVINDHEATLGLGEKTLTDLTNEIKAVKQTDENLSKAVDAVTKNVNENLDRVRNEEHAVESLGQQMMQQQTFVEERIDKESQLSTRMLFTNNGLSAPVKLTSGLPSVYNWFTKAVNGFPPSRADHQLIPILAVFAALALANTMAATTDPMKNLEAKLNQLLTMASTLTHKLSQHESSLNSHKNSLDGINRNVQTLTTKLNDLGKTVSDLNTKANSHSSLISGHQKTVDTLKHQMANQVARVVSDESKFHTLVRNISHHQSSLDSFTRTVGRIDNSTTHINTRVTQNSVKVSANKHTLDVLSSSVNAHATKLSADEKHIGNISSLVNSQNRKIVSMQNTINSHNTKLDQHSTKLAADEKTLAALVNDVKASKDEEVNLNKAIETVAKITADNVAKLNSEEQTVESISNQLMQQQSFVEERIRSEGQSGIKSLRHIHEGTKAYYGDTHVGGSALSAHDHADYDRTIGLGEFVAVMNGVDFRTRHNDYKFKRPTRTHAYNSVEDIPFPDVPPAVLAKKTRQEQIVEMRQWFKAFRDQDHSVRDYRKYFKANLCYLEGGWTLNAKTLSEPFDSDRHHIDAQSWFDLQEKIRYTSYSGSKSNLENFAYLPTTMYNYSSGIPQIAQWNYRILCHPVKQDVPTGYFQVQDDLANRMSRNYQWDRVPLTRAARFKLNEYGTERSTKYTILDSIMHEIPGKDNYGNNLTDNSFGLMHYDISQPAGTTNKPLNVGYYHRWYKLLQKGAMGLQVNHRGFRDENLWVAMTTQPNIMPLSTKHCTRGHCQYQTNRVTYALPLEIVYSTPLQSWNPLNLNLDKESVASKDGRNGGQDARHAYNGTSYRHYYRTPVEFYHDGTLEKDAADTARGAVGVLDKDGHVQKAAPTGFRIMTPNIQDVGSVRIRYPIFPVHSEGSPLGEEVMALKEMVMKMSRHANLFETPPVGGSATAAQPANVNVDFEVRESARNPPGLHGHDFTLTSAEYASALNGTHVTVTTSYNLGHQHELIIYYNKGNQQFYIQKCDGQPNCWDGHSHTLRKV